MTIINCTLPLGIIKDFEDYSRIVNEILKYDISFNILKFSTGSSGINILLDVPVEKIEQITQSLKINNVIVNKKGRVTVNDEKCVNCGACISLCPTNAFYLNEHDRLEFVYNKCIGCLLCIDSCPRKAIEEV